MSNTKSVEQISAPPPAHMVGNGFRVHNFFPGGYNIDNKRMSHFICWTTIQKLTFPLLKIQEE